MRPLASRTILLIREEEVDQKYSTSISAKEINYF
jgi:hypothetical protein